MCVDSVLKKCQNYERPIVDNDSTIGLTFYQLCINQFLRLFIQICLTPCIVMNSVVGTILVTIYRYQPLALLYNHKFHDVFLQLSS